MSLQTIQQEMEQEAKIDKCIDGMVKRFLKQNRKYRIVQTRNQSDAVLLFIRSNLSNYSFVLNEENNEDLDRYERDNRITTVFLKNKNPHDNKRSTFGDIKKYLPASKSNYKNIIM